MSVARRPAPRAAPRKAAKRKPSTTRAKAPATPKRPTPPPDITESVEIRAPSHRVWAALTNADEINRWLTKRCEFEARIGGRVLYYWNSEAPIRPDYVQPSRYGTAAEARVQSWEPRRSFTLQSLTHWPGTVTFRLEDLPFGTRVTIQHTGWPARDDWYRAHKEGWHDHLDLLRHYLEVPEAEYEALVAKREARKTPRP